MTDLDDQSAELRGARGKQESGGGSILTVGSTVTTAFRWFMGVIGGALVLGVYWLIGTVLESTRNIDKVLTVLQQQDKHLESTDARVGRVEDDVKDLRGDVREIQGRVYRGGSMQELGPNERSK